MATATPAAPSTVVSERGLEMRTLAELWDASERFARSGITPKGLQRPEQVMIALQLGMEAGLPPMKALYAVDVINNVPRWKGSVARALVRKVLVPGTDVETWIEIAGARVHSYTREELEKGEAIAWCETHRIGWDKPRRTAFGVKDAKQAQLWSKGENWAKYPGRMLMWRAWGHHSIDYYQDVLLGLAGETDEDDPTYREQNARDVTPARSALPPPPLEEPAWMKEAKVRAYGCPHRFATAPEPDGSFVCELCGEISAPLVSDAPPAEPAEVPPAAAFLPPTQESGVGSTEAVAGGDPQQLELGAPPEEPLAVARRAVADEVARLSDASVAKSVEIRAQLRARFGKTPGLEELRAAETYLAAIESWPPPGRA